MKIKTGYLYHIKDEYFNLVNDDNLMTNHEVGKTRPTYFTIADGDILWFIPISSKVEKYQNVMNKKIKRYGFCDTIWIEKIYENKAAILFQNAFPTLDKYIDHVHLINGKPAKVPYKLEKKICDQFTKLMELHKRNIKVFFPDIDSLKQKMINELKCDSKK